MDFNFFTWLRQGVKQSVLLGVSDAVEQMGMPEEEDTVDPKLLELMQANVPGSSGGKRVGSRSSGGSRKRLGRSLRDSVETEKAA